MLGNRSILAASTLPISVRLEAVGHRFVIPPLPASTWILALADDEPVTAVFPGLLPEENYDLVMDLISEDTLKLSDLKKPAFDAMSEVSGFKWWEALSLVGMCNGDPQVVGELTLRGVDPCAIPFGRWCSAVYALAIRGLDDKERQKWIAKFSFPPPLAEAMDEAAGADSFEDMIRGFRGMDGARLG